MIERRKIKIEFELVGGECGRNYILQRLAHTLRFFQGVPLVNPDVAGIENVTVTCCGVDISSNYRKPGALA